MELLRLRRDEDADRDRDQAEGDRQTRDRSCSHMRFASDALIASCLGEAKSLLDILLPRQGVSPTISGFFEALWRICHGEVERVGAGQLLPGQGHGNRSAGLAAR